MEDKVESYLQLSELKRTDFWSWFNIHITDEKKVEGGTKYYLKPGGHKTEIDLAIVEDYKKHITESTLYIKRDWILDESFRINGLALDIAGSFIQATVSSTDKDTCSQLRTLFNLRFNNTHYHNSVQKKLDEQIDSEKIMRIYFGLEEFYLLALNNSNVSLKNEITGSVERLIIKTKIFE